MKLLSSGVIGIGMMAMVAATNATGCEPTHSQTVVNTSAFQEQDKTESQQQKYETNQPLTESDYSSERENLLKRNNTFNDPNKISYIYEISYGRIVAFYTVKGKVSNISSSLTNTQQVVNYKDEHGSSSHEVIDSPQMDGSYGTNGDAIFWYDTAGVYHEWKGEYQLTDQPLKLNEEPLMVEQTK
jgi:hypothetical protein